eukprot:GHVR01095591.1.p2 GENE.GHVR01095591.1~~GHVR01095591.1.p2  ORF type:complete len:129 (-),score=93.60 GHVR01095591.1:75-461(-)
MPSHTRGSTGFDFAPQKRPITLGSLSNTYTHTHTHTHTHTLQPTEDEIIWSKEQYPSDIASSEVRASCATLGVSKYSKKDGRTNSSWGGIHTHTHTHRFMPEESSSVSSSSDSSDKNTHTHTHTHTHR